MQFTITLDGQITYTHECDDTTVVGAGTPKRTSREDSRSVVLDGVVLRIEIDEPERPMPIASVFETLLEEALRGFTPSESKDDSPMTDEQSAAPPSS